MIGNYALSIISDVKEKSRNNYERTITVEAMMSVSLVGKKPLESENFHC